MGLTALIGIQWGDEGKGKVADVLSAQVDLVVRAQGGANAGHTVVSGGQQRILHLIPSGMLHGHVIGVIGCGVVVDPLELVEEVDQLRQSGLLVEERLWLSKRAHLVLPYHRAMDALEESLRGRAALGTTGRGIGPAYQDKAARRGIRAGEMRHAEHFLERVRRELRSKQALLKGAGREPLDEERMLAELMKARERLLPLLRDTVTELHASLDAGREVLLEGAQGALLDLDLGAYPHVTSSSCHVGGLLAGSGLPPRALQKVIGVAKAYCTRVGSGPFPTELNDTLGDEIRRRGKEFGATTGRPRRCGWFDAVAARFAVRANGVDEIVLTKADVLAGLESLKVCTSYEGEGDPGSGFPVGQELRRACPVYRELPGFSEDLRQVSEWAHVPDALASLTGVIKEETGAPVVWISTGPERGSLLECGSA